MRMSGVIAWPKSVEVRALLRALRKPFCVRATGRIEGPADYRTLDTIYSAAAASY